MLAHSLLSSAMHRAITLAHRGPARDPNPQVGCVILDAHGEIIAEGFHAGAGTPHAEVMALSVLPPGLNPTELTAVVTLEPCNHTGKTPPCTEALLRSDIGTIIYGQPDVGEQSAGGATRLFNHGRTVIGGLESAATHDLIAQWRTRSNLNAAVIIAKWAQSFDGRLAAADGTSQWITSAASRRHVHIQRALADVIVTTTASVAADDPSLTARTESGELLVPPHDQPLPVVFGSGTITATAALHDHPALVSHGLTAVPQFSGVELARDFDRLSSLIGRKPRVFIEAGPKFLNAVLLQHVADQLLVYTAPTLLGGPYQVVDDLGVTTLDDRLDYVITGVHQLDTDLVTTLRKDH